MGSSDNKLPGKQYILEFNRLKAGDIFLTTTDHFISKVIRKGTKSDFSHATLYLGNSSYIEAEGKGVQARNVQRLLFDNPEQIIILRVQHSQTSNLQAACDFARSEAGKEYSTREALKTKTSSKKNPQFNRQFCSRLVAQAYQSIGISLVQNANYCAPQELLDSPFTTVVDDCLREATKEEIEFSKTENPVEKFIDVERDLLSAVRQITGADIQTVEQILQYLIANPSHDKEISDLFACSDYMNFMKLDMDNNPWRYDYDKFAKHTDMSQQQKIELAKFEVQSAYAALRRFVTNLTTFKASSKVHQLKFAEIMGHLYEEITEATTTRMKASQKILQDFSK